MKKVRSARNFCHSGRLFSWIRKTCVFFSDLWGLLGVLSGSGIEYIVAGVKESFDSFYFAEIFELDDGDSSVDVIRVE